jgi:zinc transport system substrate-binding protein
MIVRLVLILVLAAAAAGCAGDGDSGDAAPARTSVVAAFYPLAFAAEQIGGERVSVRNLTPPGAEPHDVELSPRDVERIRSADVVLYLGSGFQPAFERAVEGAGGEAVDLLADVRLLEDEGKADPHIWLDPVRYRSIVRRIAASLERPGGDDELVERLRALNIEFRRGLSRCARRAIVTSHAAFAYLADRYDLQQISITGVEPEAEPTARELETVIREVKASGAKTVFFETLVSPKLAETVAREAGASTGVLNPIEGLTEGELSRGETYFSLMRANLETLRRALGCR